MNIVNERDRESEGESERGGERERGEVMKLAVAKLVSERRER